MKYTILSHRHLFSNHFSRHFVLQRYPTSAAEAAILLCSTPNDTCQTFLKAKSSVMSLKFLKVSRRGGGG